MYVIQILVTKPDLQHNDSRANLRATMEELIRMNCVPIINANDVVTSPFKEPDYSGVIVMIILNILEFVLPYKCCAFWELRKEPPSVRIGLREMNVYNNFNLYILTSIFL